MLLKASVIRDYLNTYDEAGDMLDGQGEGISRLKKERVAFIAPDEGNPFRLAGELYTAKAVGKDTG